MPPTTFGLVLGLVTSLGLNAVLATILIVGRAEPQPEQEQVAKATSLEAVSVTPPEETADEQPQTVDDLDPRYLKGTAASKPEADGELEIPPYHEMTIAWYMALDEPQQLEFWGEIIKATPELDAILVDPNERSDVTHWLMNGSVASFEIVRMEDGGKEYEEKQLLGQFIPMMIRLLKVTNVHPSIKMLNAVQANR